MKQALRHLQLAVIALLMAPSIQAWELRIAPLVGVNVTRPEGIVTLVAPETAGNRDVILNPSTSELDFAAGGKLELIFDQGLIEFRGFYSSRQFRFVAADNFDGEPAGYIYKFALETVELDFLVSYMEPVSKNYFVVAGIGAGVSVGAGEITTTAEINAPSFVQKVTTTFADFDAFGLEDIHPMIKIRIGVEYRLYNSSAIFFDAIITSSLSNYDSIGGEFKFSGIDFQAGIIF